MLIPLQITFRGMESSEAVTARITERAKRLERYHDHITACRVVFEQANKHHHQGKLHNVRIDIKVPGSEIVVNRDKHEDIYVALRDAFDAAKRQVEEFGRRQRGDVKHHANNRAAPEED